MLRESPVSPHAKACKELAASLVNQARDAYMRKVRYQYDIAKVRVIEVEREEARLFFVDPEYAETRKLWGHMLGFDSPDEVFGLIERQCRLEADRYGKIGKWLLAKSKQISENPRFKEEVLALAKQGQTFSQIARATFQPKQFIQYIIRQDREGRRRRKRIRRQRLEELRSRYGEGAADPPGVPGVSGEGVSEVS